MEKGRSADLRKGRFSECNQAYLVTFTTLDRKCWFDDFVLGRVIVGVLNHKLLEATTLSYVVMPDHVHWLVQLDKKPLSQIVHSAKSISAHLINNQIGRRGRIWQDGYYDRSVRNEDELLNMARYIVMNPIRAGLVKSIRDYPLWDAVWV
jgi:putative transposase